MVLITDQEARGEQFMNLGYEAWAKLKGYGRRWMAETAFSTFKRLFVEHSMVMTLKNIAREPVTKIALYNLRVNL